ncbi:MAG: N-acetyltransferase [Bacteroidota bacterium]
MVNLSIRTECPKDYKTVFTLIEQAFKNEPYSDHKEQFLVERLRESSAYIPELSLVAELEGQIVGFILLTHLQIESKNGTRHQSLALAPVAVLPSQQGKGIGARLIKEAHLRASKMDHTSVVLIGHADYYPRFGYRQADTFDIRFPFDIPSENGMAVELTKKGLSEVSGMVVYPKAFFE